MPDVDTLALDIRYALIRGTIGQAARKAVRSLPEEDVDFLCKAIADHLRRCRWRQLPPEPP
jgi:hypothetical protein